MSKILYIHGFASSGQSSKSVDLQLMLQQEVIAPDLSHQPLQDLLLLENILKQQDVSMVVGSSLGGFYALCLMLRHQHKTVVINPSLSPQQTLQDQWGRVDSFKEGSFEWTVQQTDELGILADELYAGLKTETTNLQHLLVLLAINDERLDYQDAVKLLRGSKVLIDHDQDHRFSDIQRYAQAIQRLYLSQRL